MPDSQLMDRVKRDNSVAPIQLLSLRVDVFSLLKELKEHPEVWDRYTERTKGYLTPHKETSDIWVRYNDRKNLTENWNDFHKEHTSVWYEDVEKIPSVKEIAKQVYDFVGGKELGGIFITKVPAGKKIAPHIDGGWHPEHYEKFAVQVMGNFQQAFCFEGFSLSALPGQVYSFDNSKLHWVVNDSKEDRITLIICIRR